MAGWWPFKRKGAEPSAPKVIEYDGSEDKSADTLADRSHIEDNQFQDALNLLTTPHLGTPVTGDSSTKTVVDESGRDLSNFEQSQDGYWYYKNADGTFDATPHTKNDDGTFLPYSA